jgi:hypothetical protein
VLGLKEDIRATVEMQLPLTVNTTMEYALVQENLLERQWALAWKYNKHAGQKPYVQKDSAPKVQYVPGELWKARQLKVYKCANGMCYSCGGKFSPVHVCATQSNGQLKAINLDENAAHIDHAMLDAIGVQEAAAEAAIFLAINALASTNNSETIKLEAMVTNQVRLLLVDSGSFHTFLDQ